MASVAASDSVRVIHSIDGVLNENKNKRIVTKNKWDALALRHYDRMRDKTFSCHAIPHKEEIFSLSKVYKRKSEATARHENRIGNRSFPSIIPIPAPQIHFPPHPSKNPSARKRRAYQAKVLDAHRARNFRIPLDLITDLHRKKMPAADWHDIENTDELSLAWIDYSQRVCCPKFSDDEITAK